MNVQATYTVRARYGTTYLDATTASDKFVAFVTTGSNRTAYGGGPEVKRLFFAELTGQTLQNERLALDFQQGFQHTTC